MKPLLTWEYFPSFQEKDAFYEKITRDKDASRIIVSQCLMLLLFSVPYGIVMGAYNGWRQAFTAGIKVPILFALALLICFPAFYIVQYILGSKMRFSVMFVIILTGFVLTAAIMLSFSPIVIFFLITGSNYSFHKLLHVGIFAFSGIFGMRTVVEALKYACEKKNVYPKIGVQIFQAWVLILAFVGMQLAWNLRPFLGDKSQPYELLRRQEGNFYVAVLKSLADLFPAAPPAKKKPPENKSDVSPETKSSPDRQQEDPLKESHAVKK